MNSVLLKIHNALKSKIVIAVSLPLFYLLILCSRVAQHDSIKIYPITAAIVWAEVAAFLLTSLTAYIFYKKNNRAAKWFLVIFLAFTGACDILAGFGLLYGAQSSGILALLLGAYFVHSSMCMIKYYLKAEE